MFFFFYVRAGSLEGGAVDDLDIDGELAALVGQDEDTDAAAASVEGTRDLLPQTRLVQDWEAGWTFQACKDEAEMRSYNPADFEVFAVTYSDCDEPWIMCRHKEVESPTKDEMIQVCSA